MKLSLTTDTLAYQLGVRPALQNRNMGGTSLPSLVKAIRDFRALDNLYDWAGIPNRKEPLIGNPQRDALITYLLQDAVMRVQKTVEPLAPLGKYLAVLELFHEQTALRATRMFYYLVLICARESRHSKTTSDGPKQKLLVTKWGSQVVDFHQHMVGVSENAAVETLLANPPEVPIRNWLGFMADQFRTHSYSNAFGGVKWAVIADVAYEFATGVKPAQLMLDVSFALAHNTAPIFNKGMLYENSTGELIKILDVQRSGQIPQLVSELGVLNCNDKAVLGVYDALKELIPNFAGEGYVDWYKVEELGSVSKYSECKKKQAMAHGIPGGTKAQQVVQSVKDDLVMEAALAQIQVFPNQFIKKIKRSDL